MAFRYRKKEVKKAVFFCAYGDFLYTFDVYRKSFSKKTSPFIRRERFPYQISAKTDQINQTADLPLRVCPQENPSITDP
jgi:hypothetical protein